jgi:hypothetical protein
MHKAANWSPPGRAPREYGPPLHGLAGRVAPLAEATRRLATAADLHELPSLLVRLGALPDAAVALVRLLDGGQGAQSRQLWPPEAVDPVHRGARSR